MGSITKTLAPSKYEILKDVVKDYPGLLNAAELLVQELIRHPKNWGVILKELRAYALKNFSMHNHHENGIEAIRVILETFLEAATSPDREIQHEAADGLMFYLEKMLTDGDSALKKYSSVLNDCFVRLYQLPEEQFFILISNPHQLKKIGQIILEKMSGDFNIKGFNDLLFRSFLTTYKYWLKEEDPVKCFRDRKDYTLTDKEDKELEELFYPVSHANLKGLITHLNTLKEFLDSRECLMEMLKFPGYRQLVGFYEDNISMLPDTGDTNKNLNLKLTYLFKITRTKGLSGIHEDTFREISRTLTAVIKMEKPAQLKVTLSEPFEVLRNAFILYPDAVLSCIQAVGNEIFNLGDSNLVEWFIRKIISFGFQYPAIAGLTDEWQVKSNKTHLKNIRVWLELIENNPKWTKSLISALIINLRLGGVHINDTDLFQKDITRLLNSDIKPVYHLIKQLSKVFPAYFNVINAEGELRDVSTEIDNLTQTADPLVHFLRKHSHVESSSLIVDFIEKAITFYLTKDKTALERFLPEDVYSQIKTSGAFVDEMSAIFNYIFRVKEMQVVNDLLFLSEYDIYEVIRDMPDVSETEKKRALLAVKFYQLLNQKYRLGPHNIKEQLRHVSSSGLPSADSLIAVLEQGSVHQRLNETLNYLQILKDIILSPERYEAIEDIARKRHIAAGIPSMYGRYTEKKFNALSLSFRLENLANIFFEELINSFNFKFITRATLFQIEKYANLFLRALQLDGIFSNRLENTLELLSGALEVRRFSFSQYIDIFRNFAEAVQDILNTYHSGIHKNNLKQIIPQIGTDNMLPKYFDPHKKQSEFEFINTVSEQFLREIVANSSGLQQLDTFISRILKTLFEQAEVLDVQNLDLLMSYDPKKALSSIHFPNKATSDRIYLGNKGYNLLKLSSLGMPVPPGFIITTEVFRCMPAITKFKCVREHLNEGIEDQIAKLEQATGRIFGDPENPLLVSVRSGAAVSMPGMMNSFLNVGLNEATVSGLIKQTRKPWFAWDCYRRFLQCWGMFFGIERDRFDNIIDSYKKKYRVGIKIQFTPEQMKEVALAYREIIRNFGIEIIDDPKAQLETAISLVFQSWDSAKALAYREILGLSENWGTAVIVQVMVYGNLDTNSGTGVFFTRNPRESGDRVMLWGDFTMGAQGEDIVSGLVKTLPISNEQRHIEERTPDISLEDRFPEIYGSLLKMIKDLIYTERWSAQEMEFTFEGKKSENLYILQTRDMSITRRESFIAFTPSSELSSSYVSNGIGVGGGVLSGRVVFDLNDIKTFRAKDPSTPLILIRSDTVPDDIRHISAADGLLTARGGSTSHAAIIAKRLGKTCVVGCNKLVVLEYEKKCKINRRTIKVGDFLSIDGRNGSVYTGRHKIEEIRFSTE